MSQDIEYAAQLNFLKFMLEVLVAQQFSQLDDGEEALNELRTEILNRVKFKSTLAPGQDADLALELQSSMVKVAERFFERAQERRQQIRNLLDN